jgi:uncharacterized membrane-anchored protein
MLFEKNDEESDENQYSKYRNNKNENNRYIMIKETIIEVGLLSIVFGVLAYMLSYTNAACPYV